MVFLRVPALLGSLWSVDAALTFATIGDWGGAALGGYHGANAVAVAQQLGKTAAELGVGFVVNTGDNFYYCGVKNLTDEQFKADFEDIYTDEALFVPWYGVLGNHDYAFDVESQLRYKSPNQDRWQMPARYYSKRVELGDSHYATFIFLDTNPCVQAYRNTDPQAWDPCSPDFGNECVGDDGTCDLHPHVVAQDCGAQLKWLSETLAAVDKNDWVIGVGHHPAHEIDVLDLTAALLKGNMRLYLNGHTHVLTHYQIDELKDVDFVTSGAGCMVHTHDQDLISDSTSHKERQISSIKTSGFTVHTFSDDFETLTTKFLDAHGSVIHSFETAKRGSAPTPSPPPSTASCKEYGCVGYKRSHSCQCNPTCQKHDDCCSDYEATCKKDEQLVV